MLFRFFKDSLIHIVDIHSNATGVDKLQSWLNNPNFNKMKKVAVGYLVFLTVNINLQRGLVSETLTTVQSINFDFEDRVDSIIVFICHSKEFLKLKS